MSSPRAEPSQQVAISVGDLSDLVKTVLEAGFPSVWVAGEISNFSRPQSGHCYFTLRDHRAQVKAVMWRSAAARVSFPLEDGMEVICEGGLDVYPPRGTYQLVVRTIQPRGMGALELALRKLRERLAAEGLFDPARKRPLPKFPRKIAFVTSPTGAAIRDFLEVLRRRWLGADVLVVPVRVQGPGAAQEIADAIDRVGKLRNPPDCLVVGRGGGSLEDLWAFNEEVVVRAIFRAPMPVISAVGHEIDVTLSDLVADVRALTPSEAAELVVPAADEMRAALLRQQQRLSGALRNRASQVRAQLDSLSMRGPLRRPFDAVHMLARRLDEFSARSHRAVRQRLVSAESSCARHAGQLESLSPLAVLARGYSVTQKEDGMVVRSAESLTPGEQIVTRFAKGRATSRVEDVHPG